MEKLKKVYLLLVSKILEKQIIKELCIFKHNCELTSKVRVIGTPESMQCRQGMSRSLEKPQKFKSMTEGHLQRLVDDDFDIPLPNIFEELKSTLQNKALQNDFTFARDPERPKTTKNAHKKNAMSSATIYTNKGIRKNLIKSTPDMLNDLAVVSSSSVLNLRSDKHMSIFSPRKKII
ncbi:hypothetical protein SteCoe_11264 [Stentor coeruleus]|uniref:Uncharacterized protein n=1 Tax=Stentor coeruleus TaxID=5963 RepID=A0A1R2CDM0_9CILI|nr:hypothetical protein SteCoe_11264 [Stentor coeruleus]